MLAAVVATWMFGKAQNRSARAVTGGLKIFVLADESVSCSRQFRNRQTLGGACGSNSENEPDNGFLLQLASRFLEPAEATARGVRGAGSGSDKNDQLTSSN